MNNTCNFQSYLAILLFYGAIIKIAKYGISNLETLAIKDIQNQCLKLTEEIEEKDEIIENLKKGLYLYSSIIEKQRKMNNKVLKAMTKDNMRNESFDSDTDSAISYESNTE